VKRSLLLPYGIQAENSYILDYFLSAPVYFLSPVGNLAGEDGIVLDFF